MRRAERSAGILCHISALPGKYGIGSLKEARRFAVLLAKNGVKVWQILPLAQTGYGDSPYLSVSSHSGNPYFIDLDALGKRGLLARKEIKELRKRYRGAQKVDYAALYEERYATLRLAFSRFAFDDGDFRAFVNAGRFEDYALFMTAKTVYGGCFRDWEEGLRTHDAAALEALRTEHHEEYLFWQFLQYLFWGQWEEFREVCRSHGLKIVGDVPLYCAYDSADVWAHPELFNLDEELRPTGISAAPPDEYSQAGQLWGTPTYRWPAHEKENFAWWHARLGEALSVYDLVRIGHFRGLDHYYELPADSTTTEGGEWKEGPGKVLFKGLSGRDRIIAEDLGGSDDGVRDLLEKTGFPGMKVLLFAFDGAEDNANLPHNFADRCVVYTGTHDNDTVTGYLETLSAEEFYLFRSRVAAELEKMDVRVKLGAKGEGLPMAMIRLALASEAELAIFPIQDILRLPSASRMNCPGTTAGNWQFRLLRQPSAREMGRLKKWIKFYRR